MTKSSEQSRWRTVEPVLPAELPDFMLRSVPPTAEAPTRQVPVNRSHMALIVWVVLGAALISAVAVGGGYWLIDSKAQHASTEVLPPLKSPVNGVLAAPEVASTLPQPQLTVGLPPLIKTPAGEPTTPAAAPSPATAPAAETASSVPMPPASETPVTKPVAAPQDDVFRVRFDSKVPGLTPTGIRALDAALRAVDAGRKVRIAIEGCESGEGAANGVDCAALTRCLKRILTTSGVDHPGALIASPR